MPKTLIRLIFIISPLLMWSHNPLSSTYNLEIGANASLVSINLSQDAVNSALLKTHALSYLNGLERNEFEELVVAYVKANFNLTIDGTQIMLEKGGVKLGSHQTDLKFVLPPYPKKINDITIYIPAFKENGKHQTIFRYTVYDKQSRVILSQDNDYRAEIVITPAEPGLLGHKWFAYSVVAVLVLLAFVMIYLKFRTKKG
ncbi:MAG: hypothetical protein NWQ19_08410 [Nonlabens sp.]|nr:hypothetical protein [Nonlabens sp.]